MAAKKRSKRAPKRAARKKTARKAPARRRKQKEVRLPLPLREDGILVPDRAAFLVVPMRRGGHKDPNRPGVDSLFVDDRDGLNESRLHQARIALEGEFAELVEWVARTSEAGCYSGTCTQGFATSIRDKALHLGQLLGYWQGRSDLVAELKAMSDAFYTSVVCGWDGYRESSR